MTQIGKSLSHHSALMQDNLGKISADTDSKSFINLYKTESTQPTKEAFQHYESEIVSKELNEI